MRSPIKMNCRLLLFSFLCLSLMLLPKSSGAAEVLFVPSITLSSEYNDNIDFNPDSADAQDDFAGSAIPEASLEYHTERLNLNSRAKLDFKKYLHDTNFDRTNQLYEIGTKYQAHTRWTLSGNYEFLRDETIDTQFETTGRVFERNRTQRQNIRGGVSFAMTELTDIGLFLRYGKVDFSGSDNTDYDFYMIEFPYSKRFQNELDTISLTPAYYHYKSDDNEKAKDYRLTFGWQHLISETLTFNLNAGGRYTTVEDYSGEKNSNFGGVGSIGLARKGETFSSEIRYSRDLSSTTEGEIILVDRLFAFADKRITERFGIRFMGNAYYSNRENNDEPTDKVVSFELTPAIYYMLTENHSVELLYNYRNQRELDEPGNPTTQRNYVALSFNFVFPKKWD